MLLNSKLLNMKLFISLFIVFALALGSCTTKEGPYISKLPGLWQIKKVYGPHADDIRGGYMEFTDEGAFIWSTQQTAVEGTYEDFEGYFKVQYKGHEVKKQFEYKFEGDFLVVIPQNSGQKFFLQKVEE